MTQNENKLKDEEEKKTDIKVITKYLKRITGKKIDIKLSKEELINIIEELIEKLSKTVYLIKGFDLEVDKLKSWNEMNMKKNERLVQKIENELTKK